MRLSILVVCLAVLTLGDASKAFAEEDFLREGIDAYQKGKYSEAVGYFGAAKGNGADNPMLHYYLANALLKVNAPADALREYKLARDLSPGSKIATYCQSAIDSLERAAAPAQPVNSQTKSAEVQRKMPQIICYMDNCKLCDQIAPTLDQLYSQFSKDVIFTWVSNDPKDLRSQAIAKKYEINSHPTVLLLNEYGTVSKKYNELINAKLLESQVANLAYTGRGLQPSTALEKNLFTYRKQLLDDVSTKVQQEQQNLQKQLEDIDKTTKTSIENLNGGTPMTFSRAWRNNDSEAQAMRFRADAEKKKQELRSAFAKKRMDLYASAEDSIGREEERSKREAERLKGSPAAGVAPKR